MLSFLELDHLKLIVCYYYNAKKNYLLLIAIFTLYYNNNNNNKILSQLSEVGYMDHTMSLCSINSYVWSACVHVHKIRHTFTLAIEAEHNPTPLSGLETDYKYRRGIPISTLYWLPEMKYKLSIKLITILKFRSIIQMKESGLW